MVYMILGNRATRFYRASLRGALRGIEKAGERDKDPIEAIRKAEEQARRETAYYFPGAVLEGGEYGPEGRNDWSYCGVPDKPFLLDRGI
jgi:hypothetical protein